MAKSETTKLKLSSIKDPSGLGISRSGNQFTFSWKLGEKYDKQQLQYQLVYAFGKSSSWISISINKNTKSKSQTVNLNSFKPVGGTYLIAVRFRVRGYLKAHEEKSGKKKVKVPAQWSKWVEKEFQLQAPNAPSLSAAVNMNQTPTHETTFTWSVGDDAHKWARDVKWESILAKEPGSGYWDSRQTGWQTGTGGLSASKVITEQTETLANGAYIRHFRVMTRGTAGESGWVYSSHAYSSPYQTKIDTKVTKASRVTDSDAYKIIVGWTTAYSSARPIDEIEIEYVIHTPLAGLVCPTGLSWQNVGNVKNTGGADKIERVVSGSVDEDECMYVRVNNIHDNNTTYGQSYLVAKGVLSVPSNLSIVPDSSTYRMTVNATNNSSVPDSFLVIRYKTTDDVNGIDIGIIPHGESSATVQCPNWDNASDVSIEVYAAQGSATYTEVDSVRRYSINANMRSSAISAGGIIPASPKNVTLSRSDILGTVLVTWEWAWREANAAEVSWSSHSDAWESTDEPSTYTVNNARTSRLNISGLATGITWYVRVRLLKIVEGNTTYGDYSEIKSIDLSSAPAIPVLALSKNVIVVGESFNATWAYMSTDGTLQSYAEIAEVTTQGGVTTYTPIAHTETAQHITLDTSEEGLNWSAGETHALAVQVTSASGHLSDGWSDAKSITVAEPLVASITSTSLVTKNIYDDDNVLIGNTRCLTQMPLNVTISGAGSGGQTMLSIIRADDYHVTRPDENEFNGYEGETIAIVKQYGEDTISLAQNSPYIIGSLDDGAKYKIVATVQDNLGQKDETYLDFEVHWDHQAIIPDAETVSDNFNMVTRLTPIAPTGTLTGDVCDIYRLGVDKPTLIYSGAEFGTTYVDPYPVIGEYGGHRFVFRTINGDFITEDNELAWVDTYDPIDTQYSVVIDFGSDRVNLSRNVDLSSKWEKDFEETRYLGGSIQGDWNSGVLRTGSIDAVALTLTDQDTIQAMRRLAEYTGICHVRTADGSSYAADIQVSEDYDHKTGRMVASFSLEITRVDPEELDGLTYEDWFVEQGV